MGEREDEIYSQYRTLIKTLVNGIVINNPSVVSIEDLQQAGALALMMAINSYDPSLGSLQSYIRSCVRYAILEQANIFNSVFTVDEKVRRQVNMALKLRKQGLTDEEIMSKLGIKTRATFTSIMGLVDQPSDISHIDISIGQAIEEDDVVRILDEIGLDESERQLVNLLIEKHSMDDLEKITKTSRSHIYKLKSSIKDKILKWGQK